MSKLRNGPGKVNLTLGSYLLFFGGVLTLVWIGCDPTTRVEDVEAEAHVRIPAYTTPAADV